MKGSVPSESFFKMNDVVIFEHSENLDLSKSAFLDTVVFFRLFELFNSDYVKER